MCLSVHRCICVEKKNQLDVTEGFIALMIRSTCFGHFYAHHQDLETICVITVYGVQCVVAGCRGSVAGQQAESLVIGMLHDSIHNRTLTKNKRHKLISPVTGLEWPRGFQEVKVPRFLDVTGRW